ncbi:MAG: hypothetical protein QX195_12520 [Methylococcaceae bacterium]
MNTFAFKSLDERLMNAQSKQRMARLKFQERLIDDINSRYERVGTIATLLNNINTFKQIGA